MTPFKLLMIRNKHIRKDIYIHVFYSHFLYFNLEIYHSLLQGIKTQEITNLNFEENDNDIFF